MSNFEKDIQSKLYDFEASFSADLWDKIEKGIPQQKKKRPVFWFLVGSILVGSGLLTLFLLEGSYFSKKHSFSSTSINKPIITKQPKINDQITLSSNVQENKKEKVDFTLAKVSKRINESKKHSQISNTHKKIGSIIENSTNFTTDIDNRNLNNDLLEKELITNVPSIVLKVDALKSDLLLLPDIEDYNFRSPECPPFGKIKNSSLIAEIYYSSDFPIKSFSSKNSEYNNYRTERSRSESNLYSFSTGVRVAYITKNHYGIKTGINYSQINEQFSYIDPDAYQSQTIITIDTIFSGGVATVVTDTSFLSIPGTLAIQNVNRYKFIDIPLLATYEFDFGNRFYYAVDMGVLLNFSFAQEGRFLNESSNISYFSPSRTDSEIIYKNGVGMSLYGGFSILYRWKKKIDLFVSPSVRYYNQSITTEDYPLEQNYIIPALNFGARFKIK